LRRIAVINSNGRRSCGRCTRARGGGGRRRWGAQCVSWRGRSRGSGRRSRRCTRGTMTVVCRT